MLVSLKEILKLAEAKKCAFGSFNTPNLESLCAVIEAAEELNMPVVVMHAQIHEEMKIAKLDVMGEVMLTLAEKASVPISVHLDHGTDIAYIKRALDIGFTSVMYDGSLLPYKENFANTSIVVEMASRYGATVEAEIGTMGAREGGGNGAKSVYTEPEAAKMFAEATGLDALACAFGTAHGIYLTKPVLDFDRLRKIREIVDPEIPLVMHGGSGVSVEDYRKVIALGIRKINYYTYMAKAGGSAVCAMENKTFYHDMAVTAKEAMREDALNTLRLFGEVNE